MNALNTVAQQDDTYNLDNSTHTQLQNHVNEIASNIPKGMSHDYCQECAGDINDDGYCVDCNNEYHDLSGFDYLEGVYDIQYIVTGDKQYLGARVLVAFGGPNIWVNTQTATVEGSWWVDKADAQFVDNIGLDEALEELWGCS